MCLLILTPLYKFFTKCNNLQTSLLNWVKRHFHELICPSDWIKIFLSLVLLGSHIKECVQHRGVVLYVMVLNVWFMWLLHDNQIVEALVLFLLESLQMQHRARKSNVRGFFFLRHHHSQEISVDPIIPSAIAQQLDPLQVLTSGWLLIRACIGVTEQDLLSCALYSVLKTNAPQSPVSVPVLSCTK